MGCALQFVWVCVRVWVRVMGSFQVSEMGMGVLLHCLTQHKQQQQHGGSQPDTNDALCDVESLSMVPLISAALAIFYPNAYSGSHSHTYTYTYICSPPARACFSYAFPERTWRMQMRWASKSSEQDWEWQVAPKVLDWVEFTNYASADFLLFYLTTTFNVLIPF